MHHFKGNKGTEFFHNGDFSGNVSIKVPVSKSVSQEIEVAFEDLKELVAEFVRSEKIGKLEDAEADEILGVMTT